MWQKGQPWRVVNSLNVLNQQIREYAPRSVPPATDANAWGSIADDAHSSTSDHYPQYIPALGPTAVVTARDFPHAPRLGLDAGVVTEHMRISRDARVQYIIFNRRITGVNHGWEWQSYTGSDPHDTHFHVSVKHAAIVDSSALWSLPNSAVTVLGGTEMTLVQTPDGAVWAPANGKLHHVTASEWNRSFTGANPRPSVLILDSQASLDDFKADPDTVTPTVDPSQIVGAMVHDPNYAAFVETQSFNGAQQAERE